MITKFNNSLAAMLPRSRLVGPREREARRGRPYRFQLGANESLFGPSPKALATLLSRGSSVNSYCDPTHSDLRSAIASSWGQTNSNVAVGEGVEGLLEICARAFLNKGDVVITTRGTYPTLSYYVNNSDAKMVFQPYTYDRQVDLVGIAAVARRQKARMVYVVNPDNPTGSFLTATMLLKLLDDLPEGCVLLLDEAYAEYAPPGSLLDRSVEKHNLVRLRSFSKIYGLAGARIGYAVAHESIISFLERIRQRYGVSKLSQEMAVSAFFDDEFVNDTREKTLEGLAHYAEIAREVGALTLPSKANFLTFDFGSRFLADWVTDCCEKNDVLVMRPDDPLLDRCVRVTVAPLEARVFLRSVLSEAVGTAPDLNEQLRVGNGSA